MNTPQQKFIHAGFGNVICANRVTAILNPSAANARRQAKAAKDASPSAYVDISYGRATKSLQLMDDGTMIGCSLTYRTLMSRLNTDHSEAETEGEDKCESSVNL